MEEKIVSYKIKYCNARCPHFYHSYDDNENIWCSELNRKIFDTSVEEIACVFDDEIERSFPEDCPLKRA